MSEVDPIDTRSQTSKLNQQMSPVTIAILAGVVCFAWSAYQYSSLMRGLAIGGVVAVLLFWLVWQGQKLEKNRKDRKPPKE